MCVYVEKTPPDQKYKCYHSVVIAMEGVVVDLRVQDIRFPTSLEADGSDAIHPDPDYSACYVTLTTDNGYNGYGLAFTLGRGNEIVCHCIDSLRFLVIGVKLRVDNDLSKQSIIHFTLQDVFDNMGKWLYKVNNEGQLRWLGPEKGVIGMAVAAIVNSLWDLRSRIEGKPLWKLLVDFSPEEIIKLIDFT